MAGGNKKNLVGQITQGKVRGSAMASALESALTKTASVNSIETAKMKIPLTKNAIGK